MLSLKVPFDSLTFTSQIVEALENQELLPFEPEWDVPLALQEVVRGCTQQEPEWRPSFDEILQVLMQLAEGFPTLHSLVIKKWKQNGQVEWSDQDSAVHLLQQNLHDLEQREVDILQQIEALQASLQTVREQKNQVQRKLNPSQD